MIKILTTAILLTISLYQNTPAFYDSLWNKFDHAKKNKLPKTADQTLDTIIELSSAGKKHAHWLKAVCIKALQSEKDEGSVFIVDRINYLEQKLKNANPQAKPLLKIVLARWYWRYFDRNKLKHLHFNEDSVSCSDFTTWPIKKLFSRIESLYLSASSEKEKLLKIPVSKWSDFLEPGNLCQSLRPTLYDFVAWETLTFYTIVEQIAVNPEDTLQIDAQSNAFAPIDSFLGYRIEKYDNSPVKKAILLYQELMNHYRKTGNTRSLVETDLHRLHYISNTAKGDNKKQILIKRLNELSEKYDSEKFVEVNAVISFRLACALLDEEEYVSAHNIARNILKITNDSLMRISFEVMIERITNKQFNFSSDNFIYPGKPWKIKTEYKNVPKVYFRAVREDVRTEILHVKNCWSTEKIRNDSLRTAELIQQKPQLQWHINFDSTEDHKSRSSVVTMPPLKTGHYRIIASLDPQFSEPDSIKYTTVLVTPLYFVSRNTSPNSVDYLVLDGVSGEPCPDLPVKLYFIQDTLCLPCDSSFFTDSLGRFDLTGNKNFCMMEIIEEDLVHYREIKTSSISSHSYHHTRTLLYTDRKMYRPGQTIHFKGICVSLDELNDNYQVLPNYEVEVVFIDANRKVVSRETLVTNDFGSFSGTFSAPFSLSGHAEIIAEKPGKDTNLRAVRLGSASFRVEEYRLSTFSVHLKEPQEEFIVGDTIRIKGKAHSFSGGTISDALIKYKVTRHTRFPVWRKYFYNQQHSRTDEIIAGELMSERDGSFYIPFPATPDTLDCKDDYPVYRYNVNVTVTTSDGESHSEKKDVFAGYNTMELNLSLDNKYPPVENKSFNLNIDSRTHNGAPVVSKGTLIFYRLKQPSKPVLLDFINVRDYSNRLLEYEEGFDSNWKRWPVERKSTSITYDEVQKQVTLKLKNGLYKVEAVSKDSRGSEVKSYLFFKVLPSHSKRKFPVKLPSYSVASADSANVGDTVHFFWGTGFESGRALIEIVYANELRENYWTDPERTMHSFSLPIKDKHRGGISVFITFVKNYKTWTHSHSVAVPWSNKVILCSLSTFRSKMVPGEKEKWKVTFMGNESEELGDVEVLAMMYDISLDQIYPYHFREPNLFRMSRFYRETKTNNRQTNFKNLGKLSWPGRYPALSHFKLPYEIDAQRPGDYLIGGLMGGGGGGGLDLKKREKSYVLFDDIKVRKNLDETAFFYPHLQMETDGTVSFEFTAPEKLSGWKLLLLAHDKECRNGTLVAESITQKELMVQPNPPRFLRENDTIQFTSRITNMRDSVSCVFVNLELNDPENEEGLNDYFKVENSTVEITLAPESSGSVSWEIIVPQGAQTFTYTVKARSETHTDGEDGIIPVLSSRLPLIASTPITINGPGSKEIVFGPLAKLDSSTTMEATTLTLQMNSNPALVALSTLPFLINYNHESSEKLFNSYFANTLAIHLKRNHPYIEHYFQDLLKEEDILSSLEDSRFKTISVENTPWLRRAESENQRLRNSAILFSDSALALNQKISLNKLREIQLTNGSWPWFSEYPNIFLTSYIVSGFARLKRLSVPVDLKLVRKAVNFLDNYYMERYFNPQDSIEISYRNFTFYLYARSFYLEEIPPDDSLQKFFNAHVDTLESNWTRLNSLMSEAQAAIVFHRFGKTQSAQLITQSLKERSLYNKEEGRSWKNYRNRWFWYHAPIETQTVIIEAFNEILKDSVTIEQCKTWLIRNKHTHSWRSSRATADAVYSLFMNEKKQVESDVVRVSLGSIDCTPDLTESRSGYYEKAFSADKINSSLQNISLSKNSQGSAWGGIFFEFFDDIKQVSSHKSELSINKELFVYNYIGGESVKVPLTKSVRVGDLIKVKLTINTERDMEFVHLSDMRASGTEPVETLSGYRFQSRLGYYQVTRDLATHFYFDYLPKGTYTLEYELRARHAGCFQSGLAQIECMYAPEFNSFSNSIPVNIVTN